jgi:nitroreductase
VIQKPAKNQYPLHDLLKQRWSPRAFSSQPVEREKLLSLFEAVRWSPSCYNAQSWRLIVATQDEPEAFAKLLSCLTEGNQGWAKYAPVLMLTLARATFEVDGSVNRHAWYDVGLAMANMIVQATSMGLMVRQMAGIQPEHARMLYHIPQEYDVVTAVALGYQGTTDHLSEKNQRREGEERTRKPLHELVFGDEWGKPSPLIDN